MKSRRIKDKYRFTLDRTHNITGSWTGRQAPIISTIRTISTTAEKEMIMRRITIMTAASILALTGLIMGTSAGAHTTDIGLGPTAAPAPEKTASTPDDSKSDATLLGPDCHFPYICSQTNNDSHLGVYAGRDWTCGGTSGTVGGEGCVRAEPRRWIAPDSHTPLTEDWDSFRVDAGYCYRVRFSQPLYQWTSTYNRSGASAVWVKVEDHTVAIVTAQRHGSCP